MLNIDRKWAYHLLLGSMGTYLFAPFLLEKRGQKGTFPLTHVTIHSLNVVYGNTLIVHQTKYIQLHY